MRSNVTVDLPGLELSFRVNSDGLLESRQLRAFVDSDQDAGTLYGLKSKLVLCDNVIPENRSILVAMGDTQIERHESHLRILISHIGFYARFTINKVHITHFLVGQGQVFLYRSPGLRRQCFFRCASWYSVIILTFE